MLLQSFGPHICNPTAWTGDSEVRRLDRRHRLVARASPGCRGGARKRLDLGMVRQSSPNGKSHRLPVVFLEHPVHFCMNGMFGHLFAVAADQPGSTMEDMKMGLAAIFLQAPIGADL